ncbi:hypothetical protein V1511DRAFT_528513 [Dipodascopsis uninucleata]
MAGGMVSLAADLSLHPPSFLNSDEDNVEINGVSNQKINNNSNTISRAKKNLSKESPNNKLGTISSINSIPWISPSPKRYADPEKSLRSIRSLYSSPSRDWEDPELSEEWISQPNSPSASVKQDDNKFNAKENAGTGTIGTAGTTGTTGTSGTTRISPEKKPAFENYTQPALTPDWSKLNLSKDLFSPMTLERMFKPDYADQSYTSLRLKQSQDTHSKLKASLDRLKSQLDKVSPIVSGPTSQNSTLSSKRSSQSKSSSKKFPSSLRLAKLAEDPENQPDSNSGEGYDELQPPQQQDFTFTVERSKPQSPPKYTSPLKLFQNRDTYTTSTFEDLLPTLDSQAESDTSEDEGREPGDHLSVSTEQQQSPQRERTPKRPRLDMVKQSVTVTTQDFLSQAEHIMDMLRGLKKPNDSFITDDGMTSSFRQSEITTGTHSDGGNSTQLPIQHTDTTDRIPTEDVYFNSIRNRYETSSTELRPDLGVSVSTLSKRSLADIGQDSSPAVYSSRRHSNREKSLRSGDLSENRKHVTIHSPNKQSTYLPSSMDGDEFKPKSSDVSSASTKKTTSTAASGAMQVIRPEQVEKLIPTEVGMMVFDPRHHRWVKKNKSQTVANNVDDDDVFQGIDDLTEEEQGQEVYVDEYRNSLQRSLSSLEETLSRSPSTNQSESEMIPRKHRDGGGSLRNIDSLRQSRRVNNRTHKEEKRIRPKDHAQTPISKPEVSFALPSIQNSPYAPDASYVAARHDATAVSQLESSFSIAVHNLVKILSDIQPFEPYWEDISMLDMQSRDLETLVRLEEWCPRLLDLNVSENHLGYLTGVPESTRVLHAAKNNLSELTAFGFLSNLQYLDLSDNQIETLNGMSKLIHLRELIIDNNELLDISGIMNLDGLLRLSARGNQLENVDFRNSTLYRLEDLDLSGNHLKTIAGLERITTLMSCNLDDNSLKRFVPNGILTRMRTLKISRNELEIFDATVFPNLRILSLDDNKLNNVSGLKKLRTLESFSIRDQHNSTGELSCPHLTDVRKLYLSGNIPRDLKFQQHFLNLQCLELASIQLETLPQNFSMFARNLRELNLSFNELSDISGLRNIPKLRLLYLIGNQVNAAEHLASVIATLPALQVLDMRMNPLTLQFYPPVFAATEEIVTAAEPANGLSVSGSSGKSAQGVSTSPTRKKILHRQYSLVINRQAQQVWETKDKQFASHLPKLGLMKRQAYQGLMFISAPSLAWLDGSSFTKDRVAQASRILEKLTLNVERNSRKSKKASVGNVPYSSKNGASSRTNGRLKSQINHASEKQTVRIRQGAEEYCPECSYDNAPEQRHRSNHHHHHHYHQRSQQYNEN